MQRNVDKIIENVKLNPTYDITSTEIYQLIASRTDGFSLTVDSFMLGYLRGMEAYAAELNSKTLLGVTL